MKLLHPKLHALTQRIIERSHPTRQTYLARIRQYQQNGKIRRNQLG